LSRFTRDHAWFALTPAVAGRGGGAESVAAMAAMAALWQESPGNSSNCKSRRPKSSMCRRREKIVQIDRRFISHFDWTLFLLVLSFVAIGITTIYSANYNLATGHAGALPMRQFTWLGLGLIAMFVAISFDYHYIDRLAYPFYGVMLLLLVLVDIIGHSGGGSQRWINLGFFRLQPSAAKLAIVLVMAKYFQSDEPARDIFARSLGAVCHRCRRFS
jgi:cell division protein FtsW (lipid II flippase)